MTVLSTLTNSNLTDFPYLVKITSPSHLVFSYAQADGDDILFTDTTGTKLDHEIEKFNTTSKELYAWVRVPTVSSSMNTSIYLYFGNASTSNQQNIQGVWNSGYVMVQHLNETSGTHYDGTSNNNDGTPSGGITQNVTGKIDGADSFNGSNGKVLISDATSLRVVGMTLEAWVYIPSSIPTTWCAIVEHARSTNNWYGLWKSGNTGYQDRFHFRWSTGTVRRVDFATSISPNTWYYVVGSLNSSTTAADAYLNGILDTPTSGASLPTAASGSTTIGISNSTSEPFTGTIDEVRISNVARSADWIKATYRNHEQTDTYQTVGAQESLYTISGKVFEDANYSGGAGRNWTTASGNGGSTRSGARVELFDNSGAFSTSTTTDGSGNYSFKGLVAQTYFVRVVTDSVSSSRTGYTTSLKPVMTYRTDASSGTAVAVTDYVGGLDPATADATKAASGWVLTSSTGAFTGSGSGKAHAFSQATITSTNISSVDFGFNFNTITNTNDAGQGSLRQAMTNMNTLTSDGSLQQSGLVSGKDNAVFMISNGTAASGLRSSNNYFSGGVATITPTSALPTATTTLVLDAQKQPGWASAPIIELNGTSSGGANGLSLSAVGCIVRGFVINRFFDGVYVNPGGDSATVQGNYIGTDASGTADLGNSRHGVILATGADYGTIGGTSATARNVISGNNSDGVNIQGGVGTQVLGNYIGTDAAGTADVGNSNYGVYTYSGVTSLTIGGTGAGAGNVISGNNLIGISIAGGTTTIQGNRIGTNAAGTAGVGNTSHGTSLSGSGNIVGGTTTGAGNTIAYNGGKAIIITGATATGNLISANSIYSNSSLGIDLANNGVTANDGTTTGSQPNILMDHPVFTSAVLTSATLTFAGYVGSAPNQSAFANAIVEIFKSDNDATGYGEGQTYLGRDTCDANGNFSGAIAVSGLNVGDKITGTATDGSSNTSEFGANLTISVVYYSKGSLDVSTASSWNTKRDGSGTDASSFGTGNTWIIQNTHAMTLTGSTNWNVSGTGTVEMESGGSWTNASSGTVTIGTLQLDNGGTYVHSNGNALPGTTKSFGATSTVNYAGSTQTVASTTYGHLTVSAAGTKTLAGNVTVAGDLTISAGTLDLGAYTANRSAAGGTLTVSNGAVLKIGGTNSFPSNYSTHTLGAASTVEFGGTDQSIPNETYGHLAFSGTGTKTPAAGLSVAGNLTIGNGTTFSAGSYTHTVQGNWSNSGTFTAGTSTVQLTGDSNTTISGSSTFNILTINKSSSSTTVTLSNTTITATLTMTQGTMVAGSNGITMTSDRTGNGIITGMITRTHTFNASTSYAFEGPYNTLTFASGGTLPTSVTVSVMLSSPGANSDMEPIDRYYDISQTGGTGFTYSLRLHYEDSEVSSPNSETSPPLKLWRRTGTSPDTWTREGATSNSTTNNWVEQSSLTNVGRFTLSSRTVANVTLTMSQSAEHPSPGDEVTYTVTYSNTGDGSSTSTVITASAPTNTTYVAGSTLLNSVAKTDASDADEVTVSGGNISINLGTVAVGISGTVTYRVVIN